MLRMKSRQPPTPPLTTTMIASHLPIFINDDSSSSGFRRSGHRYNPIIIEDYRPLQRRRTHRSGDRHHPISITDDETPIITIPDSPDRSDLAFAASSASAAASVAAAFASAAASASAASAFAAADPKGKRPIIAPDPDAHCDICMDDKYSHQLFAIHRCSHRYCTSCISQYVTAKVEDNVASIRCPDPGCKTGVLDPEMCGGILPPEVFERWGMALCEMSIGSMKFYCPYKDCSALMLDDGGEDGFVVTNAECPHCFRWFCVKCKVPWHTDFTCEQFQALGADSGSDDLMVMRMAKAQKWQRCPACSYYVEKTEGCLFVKCRCGTSFCYTCGTKTVRDHFCAKCAPNFGLPLQFGQFPPYEQMPQIPPPPLRGQLVPPTQVPTPGLHLQLGQVPGLRLQLGQVIQPPQRPPALPMQNVHLQQEQLLQNLHLQHEQLARRFGALVQVQLGQLQEQQLGQLQAQRRVQLGQLQEQLGQLQEQQAQRRQ